MLTSNLAKARAQVECYKEIAGEYTPSKQTRDASTRA